MKTKLQHIDWLYNLNNLTNIKWFNIFLSKIKEKITINQEDEERIYKTYIYCEEKFIGKFRNNWDTYFEHLLQVALILVSFHDNNFCKITPETIIIALLHDIIEETNTTFEEIKEEFWPKFAIAVQVLSKDKIKFNEEEKIIINESWILDNNWELIKNNKKWNLKNKENKWLKIFYKKKDERNKNYFLRFKSYKILYNYIKKLVNYKNIQLTEDELKEITEVVLNVKYADRIHNLRTLWNKNNIEQTIKKVNETIIHFLEEDIIFYNLIIPFLLISELKKLSNQIEKYDNLNSKTYSIINERKILFNNILTLF